MYKVINPDTIKASMLNNDDIIKQFIALYLQQTPIDFDNLKDAVNSNNMDGITQYAHHIKPTMEYIGATELRENLQFLEDLAKSKAPIEDIQKTFNIIYAKYETLLDELNVYLNTLS